MTPEHADRLAALHAACFTVPRPWSAPEIAALAAGPGAILVEVPGGFALGRIIADEAELLTIAVRPEDRGRGLARRLLQSLTETARARGAVRLFLEVSAENDPAIALYLSQGFSRIARRQAYYNDGPRRIDALILARDLTTLGPAAGTPD